MKKFYMKDNVCTPYKLILNRVNNFLIANGWHAVEEATDADTIITGTCAAFASLQQESVDMCEEHQQLDAEHVVFGCLPKVDPIKVKSFGADRVVAASHWERIERMVPDPVVRLEDVPESNSFRLQEEYRRYDPGKQFVLVETGCASNCPFCPHKMGIGDLVSKKPELVLRQVQELTDQGAHTIVLTGNDTGSYGIDIGTTYPELLREVLRIAPSIHVTQVNPQWVYKYWDELLILLKNPKIKDFQVPIQSASDKVLRLMERGPVVKKLRPFFEDLRLARPDLLMRTDLILGYPTATDDEEQESLDYAGEIFDEVAVHAFEVFQHARIAKMDIEFYSQEEVDRRLERGLGYLARFPDLLIHRGGQIYQTLIDIETPKEEMRGTMVEATV